MLLMVFHTYIHERPSIMDQWENSSIFATFYNIWHYKSQSDCDMYRNMSYPAHGTFLIILLATVKYLNYAMLIHVHV